MNDPGREGARRSASPGCALVLVGLAVMMLWASITGLQLVYREGED